MHILKAENAKLLSLKWCDIEVLQTTLHKVCKVFPQNPVTKTAHNFHKHLQSCVEKVEGQHFI